MKVRSSKEQQRQRLQREMERYLARGGRIQRVPNGTSGRDPARPGGYRPPPFTDGPRATRTDLSAVAAEIDARKRKPSASSTRRHRRPRKKLIYDDFGEPLRWVWDDTP